MKVRSRTSQAVAEASEAICSKLVESGLWEYAADAAPAAPRKKAPRKAAVEAESGE